jgi:predicted CopG family antitoxin
MAVKTITIDLDAYTLLSRRKKEGQSFSEVIKAHFGNQPTAAGFKAALGQVRLSDETIHAIERQVQSRKTDPARAAAR